MSKRLELFIVILLAMPLLVSAQQKDTLIKKIDSLGKQTDSVGGKQKNNINPEVYNENTRMTPRTYIILLADDIKQQVTSPFRATGSDWLKVGGVGVLTASCALFADKPLNRVTLDIRSKSSNVVSISTYVTNFGGLYEVYTLTALAAYGYIFKNEKTKNATFLATQAYLTAAGIETALKYLTGRQRPSYYDPVTGMNSPTWHGPLYSFKTGSNGYKPPNDAYTSFPSGHTTVAFAAATVFAMEYKDIKIVPILSYSAATLIGLSRLVQNAHWMSDVLVGAVLGYLSGRQVVNNYHRYAKIQSGILKKKNSLSFTLNYFNGTVLPGFVYKF
jgi:membrane-associated phospholipid phosphatase